MPSIKSGYGPVWSAPSEVDPENGLPWTRSKTHGIGLWTMHDLFFKFIFSFFGSVHNLAKGACSLAYHHRQSVLMPV